HDVGKRHRQHGAPRRMRGLVLLQLVLRRERQAREVVERAEARGIDAGGAQASAVERAVAGGVGHLLAQPPRLEATHVGARGALQPGLEVARGHGRPAQSSSSSPMRLKNLSAIIFDTPPSIRWPTEAMRPPTCTSSVYDTRVPPPSWSLKI